MTSKDYMEKAVLEKERTAFSLIVKIEHDLMKKVEDLMEGDPFLTLETLRERQYVFYLESHRLRFLKEVIPEGSIYEKGREIADNLLWLYKIYEEIYHMRRVDEEG